MKLIVQLVRDMIAGYEPARVRAIALAVFVLLGAFGLGSGNLPTQAEAVLTFLAFGVPIVAGELIRRKVIPVKSIELPADGYPDGYAAAVEVDEQ